MPTQKNWENRKPVEDWKPPPPFPGRIKKQGQEPQFKRFLEVLKQLHINIPLVEALEQMPSYVKFLKDILTKKRRLGEFELVALTKECSAILKNKLPTKQKDPGSFTIPVSIGGKNVGKALCDLGSSINLMPLSVYRKLGIGEARPTTVTLQFADRSIAHPEGKIEDILVQVDKFIFPADFIILDYEADEEVPIILGRPFLATGRTLIDVQKGELTMRVNDQQVTFNVFSSMKFPDDLEECASIAASEKEMDRLVALHHQEKDINSELMEWRSPKETEMDQVEQMTLQHEKRKQRWGTEAISWTIADNKGISPTICTHKINREEGAKPSVEHQRRLNLAIKDVVKKEIIKWPDDRIKPTNFQIGQKVLLSKLFPGKLKSKWCGPFVLINLTDHGAVTLLNQKNGNEFTENVQRIKPYFGEEFVVNGQRIKPYLGEEFDIAESSVDLNLVED